MLIRRAVEPRRVTPADASAAREAIRRTASDTFREIFERLFPNTPVPDVMPAYMDLRADIAGNLWVEEYRSPADRHPPRWTVFDASLSASSPVWPDTRRKIMRDRGFSRGIAAVLLAVWTAACGAGERTGARAVVRDSAGIAIVENTSPLWREGEAWRLTDEPVIHIGVVEGDPEYQLHRVAGVVRLDDGRIAVANGGTSDIRFYDPSGRFVSSTGQAGDGPGEFRNLGTFFRLGDSLVAYDHQLRRVSVFDDRGTFARSFPLEAQGRSGLYPIGVLGDRTLLVSSYVVFMPGEAKPGVSRDSVVYFRYDLDRAAVDSIGRFAVNEFLVQANERGMSVQPLPFGMRASRSAHDRGFFYGTSERYEIGKYSADGALEMLIRRAVAPRRLTSADIDAYREELLAQAGEAGRQEVERHVAETPFPETMPAFGELRVDVEGNLWVAEFLSPADRHPPRWTIFAPDGQMLGTVETPDRFDIHEIGRDYVLGVWIDEFDVQYVRLYGLIKPSSAPR